MRPATRITPIVATLLTFAHLPAAAQETLPSAADILGRYIEALGGEASIREHDQVSWQAKIEMPGMGVELTMKMSSAAPNLFYARMESPAVGTVEQGFNGEVAWMDSQITGPTVLEGAEKETMVIQADVFGDLNFATHYPVLETVGRESFGDETCYRVRAETASGRESFHFFSVDSGLLRGGEGEQATPMGDVFVTTHIGGYKTFGGRLFPTEQRQVLMGAEQIITLTEASFDDIDPSVFALPEAIKTLVAQAAP